MKVLMSNDDGILAPGIQIMAKVLADRGIPCAVVAPDRERSSIGHAITLNRPLRVWHLEPGVFPPMMPAYACDGTPSDCVVIGVEELAKDVTMVISGINRGPNLGDDLTYSGTVSAAMEGLILGYDAIAVSLACKGTDPAAHYSTAAAVVVAFLDWFKQNHRQKGVLYNINVPNVPIRSLKGILPTKKGTRLYRDKVTKFRDPQGRECYWMGGVPEDRLEEGTDVWAVSNGYASVTPIHMDMTHYDTLKEMSSGGLDLLFNRG
ncbi:5'/3'-nucleotidase SurE [Thermanaerovibrio acidaminovorans]|jgi:5'-nucleotidase|uniref:5'-nucleotidase SurE n=1 Tax=Thermanaerovibrio acidaminovorans (strain ATCC 49978 / DSM 6589 / Su883) TaxID=525903 RepID=D1B9N2_THEAS|nr:5'/3'-nucleotidase SurE [Thermanaerovibrio acidaminovorans]ACZ18985.1 stationary-phase survival protein SurE [Thermanaerovibrio acidaminovorans DSM 6589]